MQKVLNYSKEEKKAVKEFLEKYPKAKTNTAFEELRCKIGESTVTLYTSGKIVIQGEDCEKVKDTILCSMNFGNKIVLGIDETGRGEDFGLFVVAGVLGNPEKMRELRDSKKTKNFREKMKIVEKNALGIALFSVSSSELSDLHEQGISMNAIEVDAINTIQDFFKETCKDFETIVDGSPLKGCRKDVSFLVKGDDLNPVIGAASIAAKTTRENSEDRGKRRGWGSWQKR